MKAKDLAELLNTNPDLDVTVSISEGYARSYQDTGTKQSEQQSVGSVTVDVGKKEIQLNGVKPSE